MCRAVHVISDNKGGRGGVSAFNPFDPRAVRQCSTRLLDDLTTSSFSRRILAFDLDFVLLQFLRFLHSGSTSVVALSPLDLSSFTITGFRGQIGDFTASDSLSRRGLIRALEMRTTSRRQRSPTRRRTPTDCAATPKHGQHQQYFFESLPRQPFILFPCCVWNKLISLGVQKVLFPLVH
ncbi:hypothetical protein N431DRAFT_114886 [Stipitochalara longipes BDJ]|nr:hypothetical protein N431DRAFT_114886 [Stipitochalara longipes BDJ]